MISGISKIYHGGGVSKSGFPASSTPAPPVTYLIASGVSEADSITTDMAYVNKLTVNFVATLGVMYLINAYCELNSVADEDVESQMTINGTEYLFAHFKNQPYATRWCQWEGGFYFSDALNGAQEVKINWRNGYGAGNKTIRRARIIVTRID